MTNKQKQEVLSKLLKMNDEALVKKWNSMSKSEVAAITYFDHRNGQKLINRFLKF